MRFRTGLIITSLASVSLGGALFACSSSSTTTTTTHDSGTTKPVDSGTMKHDSGTAPHDAGKDSGPALTAADISACTASANSACALLAKCNPTGQTTAYGDGGTCFARELLSCEDGLLAPGTASTAAHTSGCANAEQGELCTNYLNLVPPTTCNQLTGSGATGSACSHAAQCASGFCAIAPQSACGTCQAQPTAGDSCAELTTCGQGLACYKGTCVSYTTMPDQPCSATQPCGALLQCVIAKDADGGVCKTTRETVDAACDPTLTTAAGCNQDLGYYCAPKSAGPPIADTCQLIATTSAGMPCGRVSGVTTVCAQGTCVKQAGDAGSLCVARAADNGSCNTITGPDCLAPARCTGTLLDGGTSGKCTLPNVACP